MMDKGTFILFKKYSTFASMSSSKAAALHTIARM
jgi:hypothetical protein